MKEHQGHLTSRMDRRAFLRNATAAAVATGVAACAGTRAFAANERLGVGVIGVGGRGNGHLQAMKHIQDNDKTVQIVAVADVYRPRLDRAAAAYNAKGYMDHRELLADPNVDIVCIATPDHHHGYQAIDAVRAGRHVYCEKPVTHWRQFELTKQLAQEVKKSGKTFQCGTQGMSDSAWRQMGQLVRDGLIGQPIHAEAGFFRVGDWGERGMPIDDPNAKPGPDLNWEAFLGDSPKRDFDVSRFFRWRMYEDYAGGPCTDLFPHILTPVVHIIGAKMPSVAVATGGKFRYEEREVPDTFNMLVDYPEKFTIAILGSQGNDYQGTGHRGSGQRIPIVRGWDGSLTVQDEEIVFFPAEGSDKKEQRFPIEKGENLLHHFQNWIECCRNGSQDTWSPVDMAYHVQTALIMSFLSLREGKVAKFDPATETIML
ncbi:MAG: Gfo/Idh/MocA family oxidoreductase [Candidatus Hydrogenedentes bacterium]|nr:Gfo/Idh/MocA family oxidoreductase [Candidatus Hydrogenedentota bacterium]